MRNCFYAREGFEFGCEPPFATCVHLEAPTGARVLFQEGGPETFPEQSYPVTVLRRVRKEVLDGREPAGDNVLVGINIHHPCGVGGPGDPHRLAEVHGLGTVHATDVQCGTHLPQEIQQVWVPANRGLNGLFGLIIKNQDPVEPEHGVIEDPFHDIALILAIHCEQNTRGSIKPRKYHVPHNLNTNK